MINPFLNQRVRADVFAVGDGAFDGFDAFFGDLAGGIQRVGNADDADGARRTQIQAVFFFIHGGIVKPGFSHIAHFNLGACDEAASG